MMVNFIESFSKGIRAAQKAEENKDEIDSVFNMLNEQLQAESAGRLEIKVTFKTNPFLEFFAVASSAPKAAANYWAITASNPLAENSQPAEIAKWKFDQNGYPCQVITENEEIYCEDKAALESALQTLLASQAVGDKLYKVMTQKLSVQG